MVVGIGYMNEKPNVEIKYDRENNADLYVDGVRIGCVLYTGEIILWRQDYFKVTGGVKRNGINKSFYSFTYGMGKYT